MLTKWKAPNYSRILIRTLYANISNNVLLQCGRIPLLLCIDHVTQFLCWPPSDLVEKMCHNSDYLTVVWFWELFRPRDDPTLAPLLVVSSGIYPRGYVTVCRLLVSLDLVVILSARGVVIKYGSNNARVYYLYRQYEKVFNGAYNRPQKIQKCGHTFSATRR